MTKIDVANERKNQIVRATVDCITKFGYHNFSMQDVARTAGVSKGIIHYYFLNKDDLMMAVLDRVSSDIEKVLQEGMDLSEDPRKKLEVFIKVCLEVVRSTREFYQVNMDFWTQINQKDDVRKVIAKHYKKFRETCARVIKDGAEKGVFRAVDPLEYSSFIVASVDGISLQWLFDDKVFDYDKMRRKVSEYLIQGLLLHDSSP